MRAWLMQPSKLPKAPSWAVIFFFGAIYNAIAVQCWWATVLCLVVVAALPVLDVLPLLRAGVL